MTKARPSPFSFMLYARDFYAAYKWGTRHLGRTHLLVSSYCAIALR